MGDALNGKVVIDTSNALDFSHGFPPSLFVSNTDSLAEQLQRALPEARLVKMFNTMNSRGHGQPASARAATRRSLSPATMPQHGRLRRHSLPIWAGPTCLIWATSTAARGLEMFLPLWVMMFAQLGRPEFNIKVVCADLSA